MLGLRGKLLLGLGGLLVILLAVSVLADVVLRRYIDSNQRMLREDLSSVSAAAEMKDGIAQMDDILRRAARRPQGADGATQAAAATAAELDAARQKFDRALGVQLTSVTLPHEKDVTDRLIARWS